MNNPPKRMLYWYPTRKGELLCCETLPTLRELRTSSEMCLLNCVWPSWKAFIYYLYTGKVAFARLSSQKREPAASADVVRKEYFSPAAPQCSPKSMYKLADEVSASVLAPRITKMGQHSWDSLS